MMSDDEYFLTSDSDGHVGTKSRSKKKTSDGGYKIRDALRVPRATTYTAQAIYEQIINGDINLEPEYQRDVVWPETKQIRLIDSILRNFYIPPVIFAVSASEDGSEARTCIDGKQRLTSIQRFMDGLIPHKDPNTNEKFWFKDVPSSAKTTRSRKILPEKYRQLFRNKQVVCVEYQDLTESNERDIFQRVQLGMALTPAEKLQVIASPIASFIRTLLSTYLSPISSSTRATLSSLDMDTNRGSDFRLMSQAVFVIQKYIETKGTAKGIKSAGTISQLEKWLSDGGVVRTTFKTLIEGTLKTFIRIVDNKRLKARAGLDARVSPIEFIFIALLLSIFSEKAGLEELSDMIAGMRKAVRVEHKDVRMNNSVAATLFDYIKAVKATSARSDTGVAKRKREEEGNSTKKSLIRTANPSQSSPSLTKNRPIPMGSQTSHAKAWLQTSARETPLLASRPSKADIKVTVQAHTSGSSPEVSGFINTGILSSAPANTNGSSGVNAHNSSESFPLDGTRTGQQNKEKNGREKDGVISDGW